MMGWRRVLAVVCVLGASVPASAHAAIPAHGTYVGIESEYGARGLGQPVKLVLSRSGRVAFSVRWATCDEPLESPFRYETTRSGGPAGREDRIPYARLNTHRTFAVAFDAHLDRGFADADDGQLYHLSISGRFSRSGSATATWRAKA